MKKILYFMFLLTPWLLFAGCLSDMRSEYTGPEAGTKEVSLQIRFPETLASADLTGLQVEILNNASGVNYTFEADRDGMVNERMEYGNYSVNVNTRFNIEGGTYLANGSMPLVVSADGDEVTQAVLDVPAVPQGTIIFKEIYYYRQRNAAGGNPREYDCYFTIVNNSDQVQYLDGLGFGSHSTFNSSATANNYAKFWLEGDEASQLRDSFPIYQQGWMFPGDGDDYPLDPGDERHIAFSAVDWSQIPDAGEWWVDLSDPDKVWAIWNSNLTMHRQPAPGVPVMHKYGDVGVYGTSMPSALTISNSSPCLILYRIQGDPDKTPAENGQAYLTGWPVVGQTWGNAIFNPPNYRSGAAASIFIPKEWVFDGVEIKTVATHYKRLLPEIDNGYIMAAGAAWSGMSYVRKVDEEASAAAGRTVYMDTNNSSVDWEAIPHPLMSKKQWR